MRDIHRNILSESVSLRAASERLNQGVGGIVLAVDASGRLTGVLTDGDLRRALLAGAGLDDPLADSMNRDFQFGRDNESRETLIGLLNAKIRHLPVLDADGRPRDMLSWSEIWRLPVSEPSLGGNELKYLADCIQTVWISSQGAYIGRFEAMVAEFIGAPYSLATSSGTTALQLALAALDIGHGDEVLVPAITFGACANAVIHAGATPVFVDIHPATKTIDPEAARAALTPATRAIMPVHLYGHPCDMDAVVALAREYGLRVIEDCAEALGAAYKGRPVGQIGDVGCFSFFANKVITTGEGGMVTTSDPALHRRMAILRDHGMTKERRYWHLEPGFNFRMTNLQAAIGVAQMEQVDKFLAHRRHVAAWYHERLSGLDGVTLPPDAEWADNIFWLYCIELAQDRDGVMDRLKARGVETRPVFLPLPGQPAFGPSARAFPVADRYAAHGLCLPVSNSLSREDVTRVADALAQDLRDQG